MKNFNICGIIGRPLKHSYSPLIHNSAFNILKLNFIYNKFELSEKGLKSFISGARSLNLKGFNVTVPFKCSVIKYLDGISGDAAKVEAVNTVVNEYGKLKGHNTDIYGFIKSLSVNKIIIKNKKILLMGAGGAARSVIYSCLKLNAAAVDIFDIDGKKTSLLKKFFNSKKISCLKPQDLKKLNLYDVIINATPCGLKKDETPLPDFKNASVKKNCAVYDLIYNPEKTLLMRTASALGLKAVNGLDMLIYQAAKSFELWTGCQMPIQKIKKTLSLNLKKL